jgi:hypothetical protein
MPTSINLDSYGMHRSSKTEILNLQSQVYSQATTMTNQNAHLHTTSPQTTHLGSASLQSFTSALVPFSTIGPFGRLSCMARSLQEKVSLLHQKKYVALPDWRRQNQHLVPFSSCWDTHQSAKAAQKAIAEVHPLTEPRQTILHPSKTSFLQYFSWLLHLLIGYQKPFEGMGPTHMSQAALPNWQRVPSISNHTRQAVFSNR